MENDLYEWFKSEQIKVRPRWIRDAIRLLKEAKENFETLQQHVEGYFINVSTHPQMFNLTFMYIKCLPSYPPKIQPFLASLRMSVLYEHTSWFLPIYLQGPTNSAHRLTRQHPEPIARLQGFPLASKHLRIPVES